MRRALAPLLRPLLRPGAALQALRAETEAIRARVGARRYRAAGHFYSPLPGRADIAHALAIAAEDAVPDVDLNPDGQRALLETLAPLAEGLDLPDAPRRGRRFHFDQRFFGHADGGVLHLLLRHLRPARLIEIGAGWSTALILDTLDAHGPEGLRLVSVDPHPERMLDRLAPGDRARLELHVAPVQALPLATFDALAAGDVLFIDSSHVLKAGSDVHHLLFRVLPRLAPGVHVHFHDVLPPFEYPREWLERGYSWTEAYALRAFLAGNAEWRVSLWNPYVVVRHHDLVARAFPWMLRNPGGSLWLEKLGPRRLAPERAA